LGYLLGIVAVILIVYGIVKLLIWLVPKILMGILIILGIGLGILVVYGLVKLLIWLVPKAAKTITLITRNMVKFIVWLTPKMAKGILFILGIGSVVGLVVSIFSRDSIFSVYDIFNQEIAWPLLSTTISFDTLDNMMLIFSFIFIIVMLTYVIATVNRKLTKFTCPYCYAEHGIADWGLKCSKKNCKYEAKKYDDKYGTAWIPLAQKKKCIKCKEASQHFYCMEMVREIPREFFEKKSFPIALLGAKASGKSNYIGVLINEINKKMTSPFNCSLSMTSSQESKRAYDDLYYRPLYEEGFTVSATDAGVEVPPLIFPLRFMNARSRIVNMAALTFYDTAGENLNDKTAMHQFNRYISNAHGIILLLDPLQVPGIRDKLTDSGFNALPAQNTAIYDVLSIIIDVIRSVKKMKGQIHIPLALVFTKIDVLEQYNILPEASCLRRESDHIKRGSFIKSDFENTNIEMLDLMENWLDAYLIGYIKQFRQYSFFGVSSLGGNPTGTKIDSRGIRPRRVLDPLLWLLAQKRYIKTLKA